ncbi:MAG: cation diffusion facilitator family transporter [Thermoplasmata archaeon]|nr:cation diffusion facilitator family transporter [Thermoplasmata archaeon]
METRQLKGGTKKKKAAYVSVASNSFLTLFKLIVGLLSGSISIISESLHSLNDLVAALIATYAVRESSKPPDREHRYGHGKIESVSALLEASLIIFAAVFIIHEAIDRIINPREIIFMELGIAVMLVSTVLNLFVSIYLRKVARETTSAALEADAAHLSADVYTSLGVFLGLVVIRMTGYVLLDPVIAILVAVYIIKIGVELILKASRELMDTGISRAEEKKVMAIVNSHREQFVEFHKFRSRRSGSETYLDMHIVVARDRTIQDAHELADHIEKEIATEMPGTHAMVHIEPCNGNCRACNQNIRCTKKTKR